MSSHFVSDDIRNGHASHLRGCRVGDGCQGDGIFWSALLLLFKCQPGSLGWQMACTGAQGFIIGFVFCSLCFEIHNNFSTKGPEFSLYTGPCKLGSCVRSVYPAPPSVLTCIKLQCFQILKTTQASLLFPSWPLIITETLLSLDRTDWVHIHPSPFQS
jgi:hypothetical protein